MQNIQSGVKHEWQLAERSNASKRISSPGDWQSYMGYDAGEDVFIHYRSIMIDGFRTLEEGRRIRFTQVKSEKGWQAAEVEVLETA